MPRSSSKFVTTLNRLKTILRLASQQKSHGFKLTGRNGGLPIALECSGRSPQQCNDVPSAAAENKPCPALRNSRAQLGGPATFLSQAIRRSTFFPRCPELICNHATFSKGEIVVSIKRSSTYRQRLDATTVTTVELDEVKPCRDASQSTLCQQSSCTGSDIASQVSACT